VCQIKSIVFFVFVALFISGCNTTSRRTGINAWEDATLVVEQRAEIKQLRNNIERLGEYQHEISDRIDRITERLIGGLERSRNIEDIQREIDRFVRDIIDENRKLREIQLTNSGADAGT